MPEPATLRLAFPGEVPYAELVNAFGDLGEPSVGVDQPKGSTVIVNGQMEPAVLRGLVQQALGLILGEDGARGVGIETFG